MKNKNAVSKKLLSAALLGAMFVAPVIGSISPAQAAPHHSWPNHRQERNQTFVGVVTKVKSASEFDMRFNGKTYNVYASGRIPRRLNRHDRVSVYGYRYGNNDIRNAKVTILRNR